MFQIKIIKNLYEGLNKTIEWYIDNNEWLKSKYKSYDFKRLGLID